VADGPEDREAYRLAVALARKRQSRLGAISACSDRYSSVNAAPAEQDATRAVCLLAAREQMAAWGENVPESNLQQISIIMAANDAKGAAAAGAAAADPTNAWVEPAKPSDTPSSGKKKKKKKSIAISGAERRDSVVILSRGQDHIDSRSDS
jgi:hypothetical protein